MIRTTVMLPEETHARLRRLARSRGIPLAALIRETLNAAAEDGKPRPPSFIGAVDVDVGDFAASTAETFPPITPPVSYASPEELAELRRRADEMARRRNLEC
jgi:predicted DNA-binding ribbon-helix-helix protein